MSDIESFIDQLRDPELTKERKLELQQNWKNMPGSVAFSLIERHADDWTEINYMMNCWLKANQCDENYILMPKDPNQAIIDAYMRGKVLLAYVGAYEKAVSHFKDMYKAMIEAAQEIDKS